MNCKPFIFLILCFVLSFSATTSSLYSTAPQVCYAQNEEGELLMEKEWEETDQFMQKAAEELDLSSFKFILIDELLAETNLAESVLNPADNVVNVLNPAILTPIATRMTAAPAGRLLLSTQTGKNPCTPPNVAISNGKTPVTNGCGANSFQKVIVRILFPISKYFGSCCNSHDKCYRTCAEKTTNAQFEAYRDNCDAKLKSCMLDTCIAKAKKKSWWIRAIWRAYCKTNAKAMAWLVGKFGGEYFNKYQRAYCKCL